jgi:pimeloyl-ACP methyl ester carboxylesterase
LSGCFQYPPASPIWQSLSGYLRDLPGEHLLQAVLGLRALDIRTDLTRIQCPTLVAHGRFDRRRDVEAATLYQATVNAFLAALPDASLR